MPNGNGSTGAAAGTGAGRGVGSEVDSGAGAVPPGLQTTANANGFYSPELRFITRPYSPLPNVFGCCRLDLLLPLLVAAFGCAPVLATGTRNCIVDADANLLLYLPTSDKNNYYRWLPSLGCGNYQIPTQVLISISWG